MASKDLNKTALGAHELLPNSTAAQMLQNQLGKNYIA